MRFLLIFFFLLSPLFATVYIATEDFNENLDGFSGHLNGSFQEKKGNTVKSEIDVGGRLQYNTKGTITWIQSEFEYDTVDNNITDDNGFVHIRHIHELFSQDFAMEYYAQVKTDKFKKIERRTLVGLGPRYRFMNSKDYGKFFVGVSVLKEVVNYTDVEVDADERNFRVNTYLSYILNLNKMVDLSVLSSYQPRVEKFSDFLSNNYAELTMHLTKVFDLSYVVEYSYDSRPPTDVLKNDLTQTLSFVYRFGKDDPFSAYAQKFLTSTEKLEDVNSSDSIAVALNTKLEDIQEATDTFAGEWTSGEESFSINLDGSGKYTSGLYSENLTWKTISTETQEGVSGAENQSTKLIIMRFEDEEGRPGRVENYLWSNNTLVGLSDSSVKQFSR